MEGKYVTTVLSQDTFELLKQQAARNRRTLSGMARIMLEEWLTEHEESEEDIMQQLMGPKFPYGIGTLIGLKKEDYD